MKRHVLAATTVVALLLLLTLAASPASAAQLTFQLTSDHCGSPAGQPGCIAVDGASAGTVTITDVSAGIVDVNVTLGAAYKFVSTGFDTDFGFNLDTNPNPIVDTNPTITFSSVSAGFTPGHKGTGQTKVVTVNPQGAGSLQMDGTGVFEYGVMCQACSSGGSNPQAGPLNFRITGTGLSTASFTQNKKGEYFAVDLLGNGQTGAVDASTPTVPDGGMTLMLLGIALVGVESVRRKVRA